MYKKKEDIKDLINYMKELCFQLKVEYNEDIFIWVGPEK